MDAQRRLEDIFARFPGIGPRQARRFVYHLLAKSPAAVKEFTDLVSEVRRSTAECSSCHRFFLYSKTAQTHHAQQGQVQGPLCSICADPTRDHTSLLVIARDSDYESIEKSGAYKGLYFILGGTVPILDKEPEKRIRLKLLLERIADARITETKGLREIILSLNTTPDGEHTADIVREAISALTKKAGATTKITVLGRGLSTGAELEYVDGETIKNALQNRH